MQIEDSKENAKSDPHCAAARKWMLELYNDESIVALRYYTDAEVPRTTAVFDPQQDQHHVFHVRGCEACTAWVHGFAGAKWMDRQSRLAQHCCSRMFGVLEDRKRKQRNWHVEFRKERHHDAGWLWHQKFYYQGSCIASYQVNYCPWCGKGIQVPDNA